MQQGILRVHIQMQSVLRHLEDLFGARTHANVVRQVYPAHRTTGIDQKFGGPRNVNPFGAAPDMQQVIRANDLLLGIRKKREGKAGFLTQPEVDLHGVNADRHHPNAALAELA